MDAVNDQLEIALRQMSANPARVKSLSAFHWMNLELNDCKTVLLGFYKYVHSCYNLVTHTFLLASQMVGGLTHSYQAKPR
jgi:hypothetical protein